MSLCCINQAHAQFTITENFKGAPSKDVVIGGPGGGGGLAYLTSGNVDPVNAGWLRLTNSAGSQRGYAYIDKSFPSTLGVLVDFEYKMWRNDANTTSGYNGGDGIGVFLFDAAVPTFRLGGYGGSLGYAPNSNANVPDGLAGGYIGIGLDAFGNFGNDNEGRNGRLNPKDPNGGNEIPNAVVLRGPTTSNRTNVTVNGILPTNRLLTGTRLGDRSGTTPGAIRLRDEVDYNTNFGEVRPTDGQFYRRVQIEIKPTGSGLYNIIVRWAKVVNGPFTELINYTTTDLPPAQLKLGFAASTGGAINYHEIRNLLVTTPGNVRVTKRADKDVLRSVSVGGQNQVTYSIDVINDTNAALNNIEFSDRLTDINGNLIAPSTFTITGITRSGFLAGTTLPSSSAVNAFTGSLNLAANATGRITVTGTLSGIPAGNTLVNTTHINPTDIEDQDLDNNTSVVSTPVLAENVDLVLSKIADNACLDLANGNKFTLNVANLGMLPAVYTTGVNKIVVTKSFPSTYTFTQSAGDYSGWNRGALQSNTPSAGMSTYTYTLNGSGSLNSGTTSTSPIVYTIKPPVGVSTYSDAATVTYMSNANVDIEIPANKGNNTASNTLAVVAGAPLVTSSVLYCQGATATALAVTPAAGNTLIWYRVIGGTGSPNAPVPVTTEIGTTRYYVSQTNGSCESPLSFIDVTVNAALTAGTVSGDQQFCVSGDPLVFSQTSPTGGSGTYTYQWQKSTTSATAGFSNITINGTSPVYDEPTVLTQTTYYRRVVSSLGTGCGPLNSNVITVTVNPVLTAGTISGDQVFCTSGDPAVFSQTLPTGGSGTYTYQWQKSTISATAGFANIVLNGNAAIYDEPSVLTQTTYYRRVTNSTGIGCGPVNSNVVKVTVNPVLTAGTIAGNQVFCQTGTPVEFTEAVAVTGGNLIYAYQWQQSTVSATTGFTDIAGATQITYAPATALTRTTYFRRVVASTGSGCGSLTSNVITVTVNPLIVGNTLTAPAVTAFCQTGDPALIVGAIPTGGDGTYTYRWEQSIDGTVWTPVLLATSANLDPGVMLTTTQYRRIVTSGTCSSTSPAVTVTIYKTPTIAIAGPAIVHCNDPAFIMAANVPVVGTGTWTVVSGNAVIANTTSATTGVTLAPGSTATLAWTITNGDCAASSAQVTITNLALPTVANAGVDITQYNSGVFTLNANLPVSGTGVWSVKPGSTAVIANTTDRNTTVTIAANTSATLIWTVSNGSCTVSTDEVVITYSSNADIKVVKSVVTPGPFVAGQAIVYQITATNNGPSNATGLKITDHVPADVVVSTIQANATGTAAISQNTSSGNTILVTADIASGAGNSVTVTVNGTIAANYSGSLTNVVTVTSPNVPDPDGATSTVTTPVTKKPVLVLEKEGPSNVIAGDVINYKITIKNTGTSDATGTAITDVIPAQINNVSWTLTKTGNAAFNGNASNTGNNISFTGNIPAGAGNTIVVNVTGTVLPSATGNFANTATASPAEPGIPPVNSNTVTTNVSGKSGLVMLKNGPATAQAGTAVTYTLKITNNGLSDAMNASITDVVPPTIKNVSWTTAVAGAATTVGTASGTGNSIVLKGNIPTGPANVITVTITGTVDPSFNGSISNTATATPSEPGSAASSSTVNTVVSRTPVVSITKTGAATINAGQNITYTIEATNLSIADAKALKITDVVPAQLSHVNWSAATTGSATLIGTGTGTGNAINIIGDLPAGAGHKITITVTGTVSASFNGTLVNTATATPAEPGTTPGTATSTTEVTRKPMLTILKTGPATITAGQQITYTIAVTNTGTSDAIAAAIADVVPASIKNVSWTASTEGTAVVNSGNTGTGNAVNTVADIPAGTANKVILTIRGIVDAAFNGAIVNNASVTPSETGTTPATSVVTTTASRVPEVSISKTGPASLVSGQNITYTITANNFSSSDAKALVITDQVPAGITNVSWTTVTAGAAIVNGATGTGTGNNVIVNADLPAGNNNSVIITVKGTISAAFGGSLTNSAVATPAEPGTIPKTSTSTTTINKIPELSIQKTGPATIAAGQQINYTLTINNTGTANADNAAIVDAVPADIINVSWTAVADPAGAATIIGTASGTGNGIALQANIPAGVANVIRVNIQGTVSAAASQGLINTATVTPAEPGATAKSSTVSTTVKRTPAITLTKTGPSQISAGQTVTYILTAGNNGPSDATNVSITDAVPAVLNNVSWTATGNGAATVTSGAAGATGSVLVKGNIPAGTDNQIVITITGQLPASSAVTSFSNTATASPEAPGIPPVNSNTITTAVDKKVNISAVKSAAATLSAGENITYTLLVKNTGPSDAQNLLISDVLPAGISNISWTSAANGTAAVVSGGTGTGNTISIRANVPAGAANAILVTINGKVDASFAGTQLQNTFQVTPSEPGNPMVPSNTTTTTINKTADIQIQKTGPSAGVAGQAIAYTIAVHNAGPSNAAAVTILDQVPAGIINVNWTATASNGALITSGTTGNTGNINVLASIPSGAGLVSINVTGTIDPAFAGTSFLNTATASPEPGVTDQTPATSSVITQINRAANVRIIKSGPGDITAGESITYNLRIVNDGPSFAPAVLINDVVPATIETVSWTAVATGGAVINGTGIGVGNNVSLSADIPSGTGEVNVKITGKVIAAAVDGSTIRNDATANSPVSDPDPDSNTSTFISNVNRDTELKVTKSGPAKANVGDPIDYVIEVKNGGVSNIDGALITDNVPESVKVLSWTATTIGAAEITGASSGTGNSISTSGNIPATVSGNPASVILITIKGQVKTTAEPSFTNTVNVEAGGVKTSSVTTSINQSTDLYIEKSGPQTANAGAALSYQIKVGNAGPIAINGLGIQDNVPVELKDLNWSATAFGNALLTGTTSGTNHNILTTANITPGAGNYILITVQGIVDANTPTGSINNTATVTLPAGNVDFNMSNNTSTVPTNIVSKSGLSVRKAGPASGVSGGEINYNIVIANTGPSNAKQVVITDAVPSTIQNVSWTTINNGTAVVTSGTSGSNNTVNVVADIPAGAGNEVVINIKGTIDPAYSGPVVNQATATPDEPGNPPVTSDQVITTVLNKSGLTILKSGPSIVDAGSTLQYTLEVQNGGPGNAVGAVISDQVPVGLSNIRWSAIATTGATITSAAAGTTNPVSLTANFLAGAGKVTVTISGDVPANSALTGLTNQASVTPAEPGNPVVPSNEVTTAIVKNVELSLTKSGPQTLNAGEAITYTLAMTNTGPSDATASRLTDVVPSGITNVSWTSTVNGGALISNGATGTGNNVDITANIPVNATILVNVSGVVDPLFAGLLTNTAVLSPTEAGATPITAVATTTIKKLTNLQISKTGTPDAVAGQVMTYQLKVTNTGPSTALNALITDAVPVQLEQVSWNTTVTGAATVTAGGNGTGNALSVKANLPAGQANEVIITVTGTISAAYRGTLSNTATVTPSDPDNPAVTTPPVETIVTQRPVITLSKTGPVNAIAGGAITYTIEAANTGLSNATNLVIADQVPATIKNVSWTAVATGNSSLNGAAQGTGNAIILNGNIPAGQNNKITITIKGTVDAAFAGQLQNTATATPSEPGNPVVTTPVVETSVEQIPVIVLNKTGPTTATAGGPISYVIEVTNTGLSNAKNLAIADQVNAAILGATWTATAVGNSVINGSASGTGNIALNADIPAGAGNKVSITLTGTLDPDFAGKVINTATATPSEPGNPVVVSPPVETNVTKNPVVVLTKTGQPTGTAGGEVAYKIEAVNTGLSNASGISILDIVPAELGNVSWTATATGNAKILTGVSGTGNQLVVTGDLPAGAAHKITILLKGTANPGFAGKIINVATVDVPGINTPTTLTPPVETEIDAKPGVVISKNGPAAVVAGSEVVYTITAGNTGLSNATNLSITDQVPVTLSNVSWTTAASGTAVVASGATGIGNAITVTGDIPAGVGNNITITVSGTVAASFNGNLINTATATPSEPNTIPVTSTSTTVVSKTPVLAMTKNGPAAISAGQQITYTLNVSNTGTANADNAVINDLVPANVTGVTWTAVTQGTASIISGATGTGNNVLLHANVPAGTANTILVNITGTVNAATSGNLINTASITPAEPGTVPVNTTVTTVVTATPSISLVKNGPSQISAGQTVTYTLIAVNNGPSDAQNLQISDAVPAGLTEVSWSATVSGDATVLTGATGIGNNVLVRANINAGTNNQIMITITGKVPVSAAAGSLANTATATPSEPGIPPVTSNTITTTVDHKVNIRTVKSAASSVAAGEDLVYTLEVFNDGPGDAVNLAIQDILPTGINNVTWTTAVAGTASVAENGSGTGTALNLKVNIPAGAGNSVTVTVKGTVDAGYNGTTLKNSFTATPAEPGNPAVPSTEVTTNVQQIADLQIQKTGPTTVVAGNEVNYTILVTNAGPGNAGVVNIVDNVPSGLTNVNWVANPQNGATVTGATTGTGTVNLNAAIPAGNASVLITVSGKVAGDYTGASLINTATATPGGGVTDPTPATSTVTTAVTRVANVRITKSGPADIAVGETITYLLRIVNDGPSEATGVVIKDAIPSNLEAGATWTATGLNRATVSVASGTGDVNLTGNIPSGTGEINIVIQAKVKADNLDKTSFTNTATASFPPGNPVTDPDPGSNTSTVPTLINNDPVLKVSKSGPATVNIGDPINYTIVVKNGGAGNITGAEISDPVPGDVIVSSWTAVATGGAVISSGSSGTTNAILTNADIPADGDPNTMITIHVAGIVTTTAQATFTNTVTVTANGVRKSSVVTAVNQSTDVKIEKTGPQAITAGSPVTYNIKVNNQGPIDVAGLVINDQIPASIGQISWSAVAFGTASLSGTTTGTTNLVQTTANVPVGAANYVMVTVNGVVDANTQSGNIRNQASITLPAGVTDFNLSNNTSEVNTTVSSVSGLKISKTGPQNGTSGSAITYTIKVINNGPSHANLAQISDVVPAGIKDVSWTTVASGLATISSGSTGTGNNVGLTANIPAGAGNEVNITIKGMIDPAFSGPIVNTATVTPSEPGNPPVTTVPVTTDVSNKSGISIVKSGPTSIEAGKIVRYTLEISNAGPGHAMNVAITDLVPAQLSNVTWTAIASSGALIRSGASGTGNVVTVQADVPAGSAKVLVTINALVPANAVQGNISNTATATPSEPGNPPVTSNEITTGIVNNANLSFQKSGPAALNSGETITYTLSVKNAGPSDAVGIKLADIVPSQIVNTSWSSITTGGAAVTDGVSGTGNNVGLTVDVPANGSVLVNVTGKVDPTFTGPVVNTATLTPADPAKPVISSTVSTTVKNVSGLKITKTAVGTIIAGQVMKYQIKVSNAGPGTAQHAVITDMVPAQLSKVTWTAVTNGAAVIASGQNGTGNNLSVTATIPAGMGDGITIDITGTVDPSFGGTISNIATVTPSEPGNPAVVTPPVITVSTQKPAITITKTGPAAISAGAQITYVITAGNTGLSNAKDLVITDQVPAEISNVKWTANTSGTAAITSGANGTGNLITIKGDIAAGTENKVTITITGTVAPSFAGTLSNIATATPAEPGNPPVVTPPVSTVVTKTPTVAVTKTGPATLKSGDQITYVVEVSNTSLSNADNLSIADLISMDILDVKWTTAVTGSAKILSGGVGSSGNVNVSADLPAGAGNKVILTITGTVSKSFTGRIQNTARAIYTNGTPEQNSNTVETIVENADFVIPNIITPNGDGNNDTFKIKGLDNYPGTQVSIFNRWGNEVYRSANYKNDWDGSELNEGTYYYLIQRKEKSGSLTTFKGWMFIKR